MYDLGTHSALGGRGLYGHHSRSLGFWPFSDEADKVIQPAAAVDTSNLPIALPIELVQRALAAHFGASSMAHSCGPGGCDGRWGPGTERQLDRVFDLLHLPPSAADFEVKGSMVVLPAGVARWMQTKAATYQPPDVAVAPPPPTTPEVPYESPRRRRSPNIALIVGGSAAAVGVLALGFVLWKKRGKR